MMRALAVGYVYLIVTGTFNFVAWHAADGIDIHRLHIHNNNIFANETINQVALTERNSSVPT